MSNSQHYPSQEEIQAYQDQAVLLRNQAIREGFGDFWRAVYSVIGVASKKSGQSSAA